MTHVVRRTYCEIGKRDSRDAPESSSWPLEDFRETNAYVLLGAPGSGKTTAFSHEAACQGGRYVTVRDFLTLDDRREWHDTTLYLDGLDETRAGTADGRTPLDGIRAKLDRLGRPRFRLSCREADWFGASDRDHLRTVSPDGNVTMLRLNPLSDAGIRQILRENIGIEGPEDFVTSARVKGIDALLANPQSLQMLAVAVEREEVWPETRMQAFDMACQALLGEHNKEHQIANPDYVGISDLMGASGKLCAIQLLTGAAGYTLPGRASDRDFPGLDRISEGDRKLLRHCLQTKLFEAPTNCQVSPVHRQVAEFLAARYLAGLVENGLPTGRILALITGDDGMVVSEFRGLSAWLAAHSTPSRAEVIARDPLGTVLYGDAGNFSPDEKHRVLEGLKREADRNPWFVRTVQLDSRLGDLISPDVENAFREILTAPSREDPWQSFILILIEALGHGKPLPGLADAMMKLIRDGAWWPRIRDRAVDAFVRHRGDDKKALDELKLLAANVYAGRVHDPDDSLLGCLLTKLYPGALSETEVMQYLRASKRPSHCPRYEYFWTGHLPKKSTRDQLAGLLDEFIVQHDRLRSEAQTGRTPVFFLRRMPLVLLSRFLELSGGEVELNRLFDWLGTAAWVGDWTHDSSIGREEAQSVRCWLESHPEAQKYLLTMGLESCTALPESAEDYKFDKCMVMEEGT